MNITANIFSKEQDESTKFSSATLINATYSHNSYPKSDNENEDRSFHLLDDDFKTCVLLDGHRGASCVTKACDYISTFFISNNWKKIISRGKDQHILLKLKELIKETEIECIECIQLHVDEVELLKSRIPSVSGTPYIQPQCDTLFDNSTVLSDSFITLSTATKTSNLVSCTKLTCLCTTY